MRITNVETFPVFGGNRNFTFVVVDTDEGISGVGEAGLTGRELAVASTIEHFREYLIGQDANRIEHLWQIMSPGGFFPAGRIAASALSAIDIALWDIQGKARGVPIYQLLGGLVRDKVVCYPHTFGQTTEALVENCQSHVAEGWKFVRLSTPQQGSVIEPNPAFRTALAQFDAVRKAVGDEIEIVFDAHTRLDPPDAIRLCRAVEPYHPFFMEDPIRSENPASFHLLRRQIAVPLAAGEQFCNKWEFRELIEDDLIDYARIDLCIVGGISEARKIAGWAETHYIKLALHNPLSPVSTAACLHLDLACNNFGVQEQPRRPGTVLTDVVPVQPDWADGHLLPPTRPGLGIEFDREAARKHPYQPCPLPQVRRLDGSFTNW